MPLPNELYSQIVSHLDPTDDRQTLHSLLLTSRLFFSDAERVLYELFNRANTASQIQFYHRVTTCARVARLVIKFGPRLTQVAQTDEEYWNLFTRAIRTLVNLRFLSFRNASPTPTKQLLACTNFKLRYLDFGGLNADVGLIEFVRAQDELEFAAFQGRFDPRAFVTASLRRLRCFGGNHRAIRAVLPGRDVTRLHWSPDFREKEDAFEIGDGLAGALKRLEIIIYGGNYASWPLELIAEHLTNVRTLVLIGGWEEHLKCIGQMASLKRVILTPQWGAPPSMSDEAMASVATNVFDQSSTAEQVSVVRALGDKSHLRWTRHVESPVAVDGKTTRDEDETRGMYRLSWLAYLARL